MKLLLSVSILLSIIIGFISWIPISYNLSYSSFYVIKEYNGDMDNFSEIIEKVENFEYETHLNFTQVPWKFANYSSREVLEDLALKIEEIRQQNFYLSAVKKTGIYYEFTAQNSSDFSFTYNSSEYRPSIPYAEVLIDSTSIEIGHFPAPNWYFNMSYFQEPIENITDAQFSNIIAVTIKLAYSESSSAFFIANVSQDSFAQIVVLSQNLDVIFIVVFGYTKMGT